MRYLYGDSAPFPLQYNFLTTLDAFVTAAARAVKLERELVAIHAAHAIASKARAQSQGELERFHRAVVAAVHECATHAKTPSTIEFAKQVEAHAAELLEDARRTANSAGEREQDVEKAEADKRRGEVRGSIETFLTVGRLPALETRVSLALNNGKNDLSAVFTNPQRIVTTFRLAVSKVPEWQGPRKVSDFARGVGIQIGVKKSWITRAVQPEVVQLDDFVISYFELGDDDAEIRLRRRPDAKDAMIFHLKRTETELTAEVHRPGEVENEHPTNIDSADREQLEKLWQLLRAGMGEALAHKEAVLAVRVDDEDLFSGGPVIPFFQRVVTLFAPTVAEIAKRSPNPLELSLKHEDDTGRREEIYLKKVEFAARLEPLDAEGRAIFTPLGLAGEANRVPEASSTELSDLDVSIDD